MNITPPPDLWMAGYGYRNSPATGVHDELYARALVLDDGHARLGIVATDLISLDTELVEQIRQRVAATAGIPGPALLLNSTHTHGGPATLTFRTMGPTDPVYREIVVRKIAGAVKQAAESLRAARLAYGQAPCRIGVNRRPTWPEARTIRGYNYAGPLAPSVQTLSVTDPGGDPFALLMLHACHPVVLGGSNLLLTADWCGYACGHVREATGGAVMPLLLQGCCGNINPIRGGGFVEAEASGREVGRAALAALARAEPLAGAGGGGDTDDTEERLAYSETVLSLPQLLPDAAFEAQAIAAYESQLEKARGEKAAIGHLLFLEGRLDCARERLAVAQQANPDLSQSFALQHLTVGGVDFLGLPGEMFVQYQRDFSAQCPRPVFSAAFSNGCHGYVPTAADYAFGGYEVDDAFHYYGTLMIADDCERLIREEVYRLLGIEEPDWAPYSVHGRGTDR
jgi:hypothetical protein